MVRRRVLPLVLVVALGTACSSNGSSSEAAAGTTTSTTQPGAAAKDSELGPGLLRLGDLPAGWRAVSTVPAGTVDPGALVALCGRAVPPPPQAGVTVSFAHNESGDVVVHTVRRYEPGQAVPAVGAVAAAGIACKQWPVGSRQTPVAIQPLATPDLGERWVGFRLKSSEGERPFAADVIAWQRGDHVSVLTAVGVKLLDADLTKRLLPIADDRLKRIT